MANNNGLKKGSIITVEPIRKQKDIKAISRLLSSKPRDYLLWVMGINNGLRANDLVRIRYNQCAGWVGLTQQPDIVNIFYKINHSLCP